MLSQIKKLLMPGFVGFEVPSWVEEHLKSGLGSICLYGSNSGSLEQMRDLVKQLTEMSSEKLIIATDEEGGDVTRIEYLSGSSFSGNRTLGQKNDLQQTASEAEQIAKLCSTIGVNMNLAPVADVNTNPRNPVIGNRSFGDNPQLVSQHVSTWVQSHQGSGVACTAKHFPGHGDTVSDSHLGPAVVSGGWDEIRANHLQPFQAAVDAGVAAIMTGHLAVGSKTPTSQDSYAHDVLRNELGFQGVVITDALDMKAASNGDIAEAALASFIAGADLLCLGPNVSEDEFNQIITKFEQALSSGLITEQRVMKSAIRVERLANEFARSFSQDAIELEVRDLSVDITGNPPKMVYRFESTHNPAVGEAPWLGIESDIPTQNLEPQMVSSQTDFADTAILVRHQNSLNELANLWPQSIGKKEVTIFSPGPIWDWKGFEGYDLGGASLPHTKVLLTYLKGES